MLHKAVAVATTQPSFLFFLLLASFPSYNRGYLKSNITNSSD